MRKNVIVAFRNSSDFQENPLTDVLRTGARQLLSQAAKAEVAGFPETHAALVDDSYRRRIVRNGYLSERAIQIGPDRARSGSNIKDGVVFVHLVYKDRR